ncbi:MAG: class I SAM-dependent methyltransferase [Anaerolineae bacterium]
MPESTPFDALASTYDADFTASPIARELRGRVQNRLAALFPSDSTVLELGCGTGEDALWLAGRGAQVLATDSSLVMLEQAQRKTEAEPRVTVARLDLASLPTDFDGPYAGAYSNFGPLNCIPGWKDLACWLAERIPVGGMLAFGVMSRYCLWEFSWHGLHGDFRTARRRWSGHSTFSPGHATELIPIAYPSVREFSDEFAPWFRRTRLEALGLFLPPTDVYGVIERRPRLLRSLTRLDRQVGRAGWLANAADHFWIEFTRTDAPQ